MGNTVRVRDVAVVVLLTIFTFGIYWIYWLIVTNDEIENTLRFHDGSVPSGGIVFLLSIVTCGIYTIYWWYKQGQRISYLQREHNLPPNDNSVLYLILSLVGLSIISQALMQSDLNAIAMARPGFNGQN